MDANENVVKRLKQWMEGEGMSSPPPHGVWCQHAGVYLQDVGR